MSIILEIDLRFILFMGTLTMMTLGMAIIFFVVIYQRKLLKKNNVIQEIEDTLREKELDSVYAIVDAQIEERKRIAKDLHDNVGSVLATLKMYADTLPNRPKEEQVKLAEEISQITQMAGDETRRLSHNLNEGVSEHFDFASSLSELKYSINKIGKLQLEISGDVELVPNSGKGVHLFRIIQELISNTVKHAKAKTAGMEFSRSEGMLNLLYTDDGVGFDIESRKRGIGLDNIRSRLINMEGEMEVESDIGIGTTFSIDIKLG